MIDNSTALCLTPLHAWHAANGARLVDFAGWHMPVHYETGILAEHLAVRAAGGLFDVSHMGRFVVGGADRTAFLQRVLTSDVESLDVGRAHYTLLANETGGVTDDAYLYRWTSHEYELVVNACNRMEDWKHLVSQATRFGGVSIEDRTESTAMIALQGPLSERLLNSILEDGSLPAAGHNRLSEALLSGTAARVARTGYTGEPLGFELFVSASRAEFLWRRLMEEGRGQGILPIGLGARDTLRLEAGMPLYGHEYGLDPEGSDMPALAVPVAALAVSLRDGKGDFIGREALTLQLAELRKVSEGIYTPSPVLRRRVVPFALLDRGITRRGDPVLLGEKRIGVITSGTMAPFWRFAGGRGTQEITAETGKRAIALAYIDAEVRAGTRLDALVRGRRIKGTSVRRHGESKSPPHFRPLPAE